MKHIVTYLNDTNEPVMFSNSILGNLFFDTFFGELEAKLSPLANSYKQSKLLHKTQIVEHNYTIVDSNNCTDVVSSSTNFSI